MFKLIFTEQGFTMSLIEAQEAKECFSCGTNFYATDNSHVNGLCQTCNIELAAISKEDKPITNENYEQEFEL